MDRSIAAAALLLLLSSNAFAQLRNEDSLFCGKSIVNLGDTKYSVREECGPPTSVQFDEETDTTVWVYDFGPDRFVYYLHFSDETLDRIQSDDYGTGSRASVQTPGIEKRPDRFVTDLHPSGRGERAGLRHGLPWGSESLPPL